MGIFESIGLRGVGRSLDHFSNRLIDPFINNITNTSNAFGKVTGATGGLADNVKDVGDHLAHTADTGLDSTDKFFASMGDMAKYLPYMGVGVVALMILK